MSWTAEAAQKDGYEHFMIKEIHEQPKAVRDTLNSLIRKGRIDLGDLLEAVELLEEDPVITEALGEHVLRSYAAGKRAEWDEYRTRVTDWELKRYMIIY